MMNLFIDTNVLLSFYHYSSEDLDELNKINILQKKREIEIYMPSQLVDEFYRNRELKIADALKRFTDDKISTQLPQICKQYSEFQELKEIIKKYQNVKEKIIKRINNDVSKLNLKADKINEWIINNSKKLKVDDDIFNAAKRRFDSGNPPGKQKSYGDAIIWETLLRKFPDKTDLYFISQDADYISPIDKNEFNVFLKNEWIYAKKSSLKFYTRLSLFFRSEFPHINLSTDIEKDLLINEFESSYSFSRTHLSLHQLTNFNDFTKKQLNDIVRASVSNRQIYWINEDEDIRENLNSIIEGRENLIESDLYLAFKKLYKD